MAGSAWLLGTLICYAFAQQLFQLVSAPIRMRPAEAASLIDSHPD